MGSDFFCSKVPSAVLLAALALFSAPSPAATPDGLPLRDDFDSKLTLDWKTIRPDPTHLSLKTHPGKLTITTQYGLINGSANSAKNLFLTEIPKGLDEFVVTTCIEGFLPETHWQQAGLLFYDDDDHYVKWVRDFTNVGYPVLNAFTESLPKKTITRCAVEIGKVPFWLRVIKRGTQYQCMASLDGKSFTTYAVIPWETGTTKKVGLVAKNGPTHPEMEAQFDFFEVRELTEAERNDPAYTVRRNLQGEWTAGEQYVSGKALTDSPGAKVAFTPGTMTFDGAEKLSVSFVVDPAATPNRITLIPRKRGVGPLLHGIYSLDGDTLELCINLAINGAPPRAFETKDGDGCMLLKLQRAEPE